MAFPFLRGRTDHSDADVSSTKLADLIAQDRPARPPRQRQSQDRASRRLDGGQGRIAPRLGWASPYSGRAASEARAEVYRSDTSQVSGLYPFLHSSSLPPIGAYVGYNVLTLRSFSAHPALWVTEGLTSNPNVLITGVPGSGKSAHIKALILRLLAFGTKSLVAGDVKGEYSELARYLGVEPLALGPGMTGRINPLDAGPLGAGLDLIRDRALLESRLAEIHRRRLTLLKALLELQLRRPLQAEESEAVSVAVRQVTGELHDSSLRLHAPTLPAVYAALLDPTVEMARALRVRGDDVQTTRDQTRSIRAALGEMVTGHLSGLFDADASTEIDLEAPLQVVDISRLADLGEDSVAMILACVSSWAQAAVDQPGPPRLVVRDELWRQLRSGPAMVRKIDADLRLSRGKTVQLLATHRLNDFEGVGDAGSEAVAIATQMVSSCDTKIILAQDTLPLETIREAVGLTNAESALITAWGRAHRGRALWKVGRAGSHPVQLHLTALEEKLFETDERMA